MKTPISFRLRKQLDADLIALVDKMEKEKIAELCRDGLRIMLGIRMTRQVQILERPIQPELVSVKGATVRIGNGGQAKPFVPNKEGRV